MEIAWDISKYLNLYDEETCFMPNVSSLHEKLVLLNPSGCTIVVCAHYSYSLFLFILFIQGIIFEKLSEDELYDRMHYGHRRSKAARMQRQAEKRRIAQELARRANEAKERRRLEQQGRSHNVKALWSSVLKGPCVRSPWHIVISFIWEMGDSQVSTLCSPKCSM